MRLNSRLSVQSNLRKLLILKALSFAWFPIPTIMIFYEFHGLSIEQSIFLKTILSVSFFLLEIPSGYIADQWGRKFCLVFGSSIWVISWEHPIFASESLKVTTDKGFSHPKMGKLQKWDAPD